MLQRDAAPGIHRIENAFTNWYIVEDGSRLTVVDAGLPRSWGALHSALAELGRKPSDVEAIVLTHAHFDHVGFAERARRDWQTPIWVHDRDASLSRHPLHYEHEHSLLRHARYPAALGVLGSMILQGAPMTSGVKEVRAFAEEDELDLPGRPRPVFTPGHTHGHAALHFPDRGAVIAGDAIVTFNPYTGGKGPQIVSGAATADSAQALASLAALEQTGAETVLVGHGEPWTDGIGSAVARAREAGPS